MAQGLRGALLRDPALTGFLLVLRGDLGMVSGTRSGLQKRNIVQEDTLSPQLSQNKSSVSYIQNSPQTCSHVAQGDILNGNVRKRSVQLMTSTQKPVELCSRQNRGR